MSLTWIAVIALGGIGIIAALLLYVISRVFMVEEDPRIDAIEALLPGANCGACGYSGCRDFAVNCAKRGSLSGMFCPGAGNDGMDKIAEVLEISAVSVEPKVAAVRCGGSCDIVPRRRKYEGPRSCAAENLLGTGPTDCAYGCLGNGDCAAACHWNAITIDPATALATVNPDLCTGCGNCVQACPRNIIELIPRSARAVVNCVNHDRGAVARKACAVTCIACGKCVRTCGQAAITVADNCAHIDQNKCTHCGSCIEVCPDHTIIQVSDNPA